MISTSPNGYKIKSKLPITNNGSKTSSIKYLDENFNVVSKKNIDEIRYVKKTVVKRKYKKLVPNEVKWLKLLKDVDRVPYLISNEGNSIIMSYVGRRATKETLPENWKDQIKYISDQLDAYKCFHNDIKFCEILVKDEKIYLIDFQWATSTLKESIELTKRKGTKFLIPNYDVLWVKCKIIAKHG